MQQLTRGIRVKLGLFVALALLGTTYVGARYVGLDPFASSYRVRVDLPDAGGLFVNSEVTYRGVPVGTVSALRASETGVRATLTIDGAAPPIPAGVRVRVQDRSTIGEQYLELTPSAGATKGRLRAGDRLTGGADALPVSTAEVLRSSRDFAASIPSAALNTTIDETYRLSAGAADDFRRLIQTSWEFEQAADRNFRVSSSLIRNADRVLRTQEMSGTSIRAFSKDMALFSRTLADSDGDLRRLITTTPASARELGLLIHDVGAPLGVVMSHLVSTSMIFGAHAAGVQDAMVHLPEAVSVGWSIASARGLRLGLVPTFFNPWPCVQGYGGTRLHRGTDPTVTPLNTAAGCTAPLSTGINVRGPQHLPGGR
ncbi:MlaD family protein [Nocardioides ginsengisoli]|uniref:MlaD family protein n=1 Tax=Nocardioides ginsengisoli TaxID=363868 RepID=A0ABW3W2P1_9ACTN